MQSNAHTYFFEPKLSYIFIAYLFCIHLFSLACVLCIDLGWWLTSCLLLVVGSSIFFAAWKMGFCGGDRVVSLQHKVDRQWMIGFSNETIEQAELCRPVIMTRFLLILYFKGLTSKSVQVVLFFSDSLSDGEMKSLRRCVQLCYL